MHILIAHEGGAPKPWIVIYRSSLPEYRWRVFDRFETYEDAQACVRRNGGETDDR